MLPDFHTANPINCTFTSDKMMTPTRTYSPVKISVRYVRYAETHGFTGHEHYADLKVINMNGRLYDPVIARFFSPDNFVQAPDFTQNFNRYSYCLNNPLQYVDPSGENLFDAFLYSLCSILTFPARVTTEAVSWVNDQINGDVKPDGYFHSDYLFYNAPPHYINYQNVMNLQNPFSYSFHEPDMMTDADGTTYRTEYYWAAVGAGGEHCYKVGKGFWKKIFTPYKETGRWYTRMVPVNSDNSPSSPSVSYPFSEANTSLNGFAMANGAKTNLLDAAVRYNYKSANSWREFRQLRNTQKTFRYNQTLGKTGVKYLKIASKTNTVAGVASVSTSFYNGYAYYKNGGKDWQVYTKIGVDILMTGIGFIGPVGFAISSTYFIIDVSTSGFGGFGKIR